MAPLKASPTKLWTAMSAEGNIQMPRACFNTPAKACWERSILKLKVQAESWGRTCTEGGSVIDVRGFSEGAVCAADIMMVSANHHWSLGNRRNTTRCRESTEASAPHRHCGSSYRNASICDGSVDGQSDGDSSFLVRIEDPGL